jgi:competence protein ComEA
MLGIPTRRIVLLVAAAVVVLGVGAWGLWGHSSHRPVGQILPGQGDALVGDGLLSSRTAGAGAGVEADASVPVTTTQPDWFVQVAGEVAHPGVYRLSPGSRVFEALLLAGGTTEDADRDAVPLAAVLRDGARVVVPKKGEPGEASAGAGGVDAPVLSPSPGEGGSSSEQGGTGGALVSLNSASLEELDSLPGVGPKTAQQIISYRESHGGFRSVEELDEVPGIGQATLERLRPLVTL